MTKNKKFIKLFTLLFIVVLFFALYKSEFLNSHLNFEYIKANQEKFNNYYSQSPMVAIASFLVIYILFASLALPFAMILTILSGVLFGFWLGLLLVSFVSSIGATVAFLLSRFLFKDYLKKKYSKTLKTINSNLKREGGFYLFTIRMILLFPFWMVNLLMGITDISVWKFYWVSQVGMLLGTMLYVYIGTVISEIQSPSDFVNIKMLIVLAIIGILPIVSKKTINFVRKKYVQKA